jgi:hypothetical protein
MLAVNDAEPHSTVYRFALFDALRDQGAHGGIIERLERIRLELNSFVSSVLLN